MNDKITKYIEIELAGLPKAKRNQLHLELLENTTHESFTFEHIFTLLKEAERKNIAVRQPFFENIIYPILNKEISTDNLGAVKLLIKLEQKLLQLRTEIYKPSKRELIDKGLQINAEDKEMLEILEDDSRNFLRFTIHEIPSGILYGMDGANEFECDELLGLLKEYKEVCEKLSIDRTKLIEECKFHFENYKRYLQSNKSISYEEFLNENVTESHQNKYLNKL